MPELPEVETIVRQLRQPLIGRSILDASTDWPKHINRPPWDEFRARIMQCKVGSITRRGKYLIIEMEQAENLIIHLKMTGQLSVVLSGEAADKHVHTVFYLDNERELRFRDVRKFGRVYLVQDPAEIVGNLGIEPLSAEFTPEWLYEATRKRKRLLKPLLLDQNFIAGIGNIYADEALHRAQISPLRKADSLSKKETRELTKAIRRILAMAIDQGGSSIDSGYRKPDGSSGSMQVHFNVYGRGGAACQRCGAMIERIVLGSRSTHFCSNCQH